MKNFFTLLTVFSGFILFESCQKKIDSFVPDGVQNAPDTVWTNLITSTSPVTSLKNDLRIAKVADSFSYNNSGIVFNSGSYSLGIPANSLVNNGGVFPTGTVSRQSLLVQHKGDFIALSIPTVAGLRLLVSGGAFFLNLKNQNADLSIATGSSLTAKYNSTTVSGMKVYNGLDDVASGFNWTENTDVVYNKVNVGVNGYEVLTNKTQWIQAAYLFDTTGIPETTFALKLPSNYTNGNTVAYISFNDMQCVSGLPGIVAQRKFVSGDLPVGRPITIVVISKQADDYYFAIQQTVTAAPSSGTGSQEIALTPVKTPMTTIRSYLSNL